MSQENPVKPIVRRERCHAQTTRHGHGPVGRCKHYTLRGLYCHQHQQTDRGLRITDSTQNADLGVFTTHSIPKGAIICEFTGDVVIESADYTNPYALQLKKRPPTFIDARQTNEPGEGRWVQEGPPNAEVVIKKEKAFIKALRNIDAGEEILVDYEDRREPAKKAIVPERKRNSPAVSVKEVAAPKKKLVKPAYDPALDQPWVDRPEEEPKKKPTKRQTKSPEEKHELYLLKRLNALQEMFNDEKLAQQLKIQVSKRVIKVPKRIPGKFNLALEKMLRTEKQRWVDYINQNPRNRMTVEKASEIIEKIV